MPCNQRYSPNCAGNAIRELLVYGRQGGEGITKTGSSYVCLSSLALIVLQVLGKDPSRSLHAEALLRISPTY